MSWQCTICSQSGSGAPPSPSCCDVAKERNRADSYQDLWEKSCQAVFELCDLAGAKPEDMHDLWTLQILIRELKQRAEKSEVSIEGLRSREKMYPILSLLLPPATPANTESSPQPPAPEGVTLPHKLFAELREYIDDLATEGEEQRPTACRLSRALNALELAPTGSGDVPGEGRFAEPCHKGTGKVLQTIPLTPPKRSTE